MEHERRRSLRAKLAQERLERETVQALLDASYRFSDTTTTGAAADVLADVACALTGAAGAHVYVTEEPGSPVLTNANAARTTAERGFLRLDLREDADDVRGCMEDGVPVFVADALAPGQIRLPLRSRFQTASLLFVPLADVGVLALWWTEHLESPPHVTGGLERFAAHAAQVLARRIESSMLRGQIGTDPLTALGNRRALFTALDGLPPGGSLVLVDLDHFKALNDEHGHRHGDLVLQAFGRALQAVCPPDGCAARYGGEEFALVLPGTGEAEARHLVGLLRTAWLSGGLTFSAGLAVHRRGGAAEETMEAADQALYAAKRGGRDRLVLAPDVVWDEPAAATRLPVAQRVTAPTDDLDLAMLDEAISEAMVEPWFQPVLSTGCGRVVATEALARLRHPRTGELLLPARFLPLAERTGRVTQLDWLVAEAAIAHTARWRADSPDHALSVAVNISIAHLDDPELTPRLLDACARHGLPTDALVVELTETMQSLRGRGHERALTRLAHAGVNIALDDFGTGFAALSYLLRFPISGIKIDRTFTAALGDPRGRQVISSVIGVGATLGLHVVAEGVETEEQLRVLTDLGCGYVQGYLLSRPVPAVQVAAVILGLDRVRSLVG